VVGIKYESGCWKELKNGESVLVRKRRARALLEVSLSVHLSSYLWNPILSFSDASLDSQTRSHITRKLRNKLGGGGTSPPPTPSGSNGHGTGSAAGVTIGAAITTGPFHNPHSLSVDDIPSRFPLPLTASSAGTGTGANGPGNSGATGNPSGRRRGKGGGTHTARTEGALGKSLAHLTGCKEVEIEGDLVEIRRGSKRRRVAAGSIGRMIS